MARRYRLGARVRATEEITYRLRGSQHPSDLLGVRAGEEGTVVLLYAGKAAFTWVRFGNRAALLVDETKLERVRTREHAQERAR